MQSQYGFRALVGGLSGGSVEGLVNVNNASQPCEIVVRSAFQITPITTAQGRSQVQILLAAMKEVGERGKEGIPVQKLGEHPLYIFAICLGRFRLAAKGCIERSRALPSWGRVRRACVSVQCRLTIPTGKALAKVYVPLQLPPERGLFSINARDGRRRDFYFLCSFANQKVFGLCLGTRIFFNLPV